MCLGLSTLSVSADCRLCRLQSGDWRPEMTAPIPSLDSRTFPLSLPLSSSFPLSSSHDPAAGTTHDSLPPWKRTHCHDHHQHYPIPLRLPLRPSLSPRHLLGHQTQHSSRVLLSRLRNTRFAGPTGRTSTSPFHPTANSSTTSLVLVRFPTLQRTSSPARLWSRRARANRRFFSKSR